MLKFLDAANTTVDPAWLSERIGGRNPVRSAIVDSATKKQGGMSGEFLFLDVIFGPKEGDGDESSTTTAPLSRRMAVKFAVASHLSPRVTMGLAREANFYNEIAPSLAKEIGVPEVFYAESNLEDGSMLLLLECVDGAFPSGVLFGPGNPNNWALDANKIEEMSQGQPSPAKIAEMAFKQYVIFFIIFFHVHVVSFVSEIHDPGSQRSRDPEIFRFRLSELLVLFLF